MSFNFKNRIAFHYIVATAIIMALAFLAIYISVKETVFNNVDSDLSYEAKKHTTEIGIRNRTIQFINRSEWAEREHTEVQVNPVFIQLIDANGKPVDKSPNLKEANLPFKKSQIGRHFNTYLNQRTIRQVQVPIARAGVVKGYIIAAMSTESAIAVINRLRDVLLISYLITLMVLFFISRFLAGRNILPLQQVSSTITHITQQNLQERVMLPPHKDEIYDLSENFNALLDRIEKAIKRERQFTSDASHELRTPLASLRGTLEVLIRKPREHQEYQDKIGASLVEIEKISTTLDQLLLLARLDSNTLIKDKKPVELPALIDGSLTHFKKEIEAKKLKIQFDFDLNKNFLVPYYYSNLIVDNILGNAVKYAYPKSLLKINIANQKNRIICTIQDEGIGIKEADLENIYDSFFRSDSLNHKQIKGYGLGLSIAKKCADAIKAQVKIESEFEKGTKVTITL